MLDARDPSVRASPDVAPAALRGRPRAAVTLKPLGLRLPDDVYAAICHAAFDSRKSPGVLMREVLSEWAISTRLRSRRRSR